jgi:hypothetical protein
MAYVVQIVNGTATAPFPNGNFPVTAAVAGYDNTTIDPSTLAVLEGTNTYPLTIAAAGTLTIHVSETDLPGGTAVVGAKFIRCNLGGSITYGDEVTSDGDGNATLAHVPYGTGAPIIYYKQTSTTGNHVWDSGVRNVTMASSTDTAEIKNEPGTPRTLNLTDEYYGTMPIAAGTLNFTLS